ncbi:Uncharacterised protein [Yersinia mollaretii]|nr:Uncharacterised protein [Yersinia mollaretii]
MEEISEIKKRRLARFSCWVFSKTVSREKGERIPTLSGYPNVSRWLILAL